MTGREHSASEITAVFPDGTVFVGDRLWDKTADRYFEVTRVDKHVGGRVTVRAELLPIVTFRAPADLAFGESAAEGEGK